MTTRGYPVVRQLIEAATMLHPELSRYRNRPSVQRAMHHYRAVWRAHDGSYEAGLRVQQAEAALNEAVEHCITPKPT